MIRHPFEAIVIGSGATGGIAALTLAERGIRVLVIEAGPKYTSKEAFGSEPQNILKRINGIISGEKRIQAQHPGFWKTNPSLFINEKENRYFTKPNQPFLWTQGRQLGGRSLTWGGITLRLSDSDFKASREDSYGPEWPIGYSDLKSHYAFIEDFLKVKGNKDGFDQVPDGIYDGNIRLTASEELFKEKVENILNYPFINSRGFGPHLKGKDGEWPRSSSLGSTLRKALSTGNVEILENHIVERLVLNNQQNAAEGVIVIDRLNKNKIKLSSKLIIFCASTIQSIKILLNSSEKIQSKGLIDPSGDLGLYLMDHISTCRFFALPNDSIKAKYEEQTLTGAGSFFIPFGKYLDKDTTIDFIRGYGIWGAIDRFEPPNLLKRISNSKTGFLIGHGEVLPYKENKVTLTNELDQWGIPIPEITFTWKDNELKMIQHINKTIEKCILASGGEMYPLYKILKIPFLKQVSKNAFALNESPPPPGYYIHEVGGARMGTNIQNSVLDKWNRMWTCKNVLVVDGACWPTSAWQSPTLTMMAITRRACLEAIKHQTS